MWSDLGIVFLLLLLNGFFAMAELAIVSARPARLRAAMESKKRGAKEALAMSAEPTSFLSVVQIGVTLNSILVGAFSGQTLAGPLAAVLQNYPATAPYSQQLAMVVTIGGATYASLVVGELLPKRIGMAYAEAIAVRVSGLMIFLSRLVAPLVWILRFSTESLFRLFRLDSSAQASVTEDEVKDLIAQGALYGAIKPAEKNMLEGVMRLADRSVRTIMTPRIDMAWLSVEDKKDEQTQTLRTSGYSRFPVAHGDLEQVVGIVAAKDMLNAVLEKKSTDLAAVMRPPLLVPDTTSVLRLLDQFRQTRQHLAVVVDEYGSVEGLVTLTDVMESIAGHLPETGQDSESRPVRRADGSWLIDGMMPLDEVEMVLGLKNMQGSGDFYTLAGFVMHNLGRLPKAGDVFSWNDARFEVVDMDARRVDKVLVYPPHAEKTEDEVVSRVL